MHIDIFNGDADGICALHQCRLHTSQVGSRLITGVKRNIRLLKQIEDVKECTIDVFDISLDSNRIFLDNILKNNDVCYYDHHFAGAIPKSPRLRVHIAPSPDTCTSLIVNSVIEERHPLWAICGAFGDNLHQSALTLAQKQNLSTRQTEQLREIGELFNYNGYGTSLTDLLFHPLDLYRAVQPYDDPCVLFDDTQIITELRSAYNDDLAKAMGQKKLPVSSRNGVYIFPGQPWARRISGVFSNFHARKSPDSAHAIFTENEDRTFTVSVRAPLNDKRDADKLCKLYPTGGGRAAAAGVNKLPAPMLDNFLAQFHNIYK
jgi:hypothetical protein